MGTATATFRGDAQLCVGDGVEEQLADDDYDVAWMFDDDESLKLVAGRRIVFKLASRAGESNPAQPLPRESAALSSPR